MNDDYGYMYVLDYESNTIFECVLGPQDENLEASDILERRGFKESNCNYMTSEVKLNLVKIPNPKN